jgi:hypothetical protein
MKMLTWLVDFLDRRRQRRVETHLRVHRAWLASPEQGECYFLNVQNASPEREVTVTHVWIASEPPVEAMAKELPARIKPGDQWETWIPVDRVPATAESVERLGRAQLGDDNVLKSVPRTEVPSAGYVPG